MEQNLLSLQLRQVYELMDGQRLTQRQVRQLIREVLQEVLTIQARAGIRTV